MTPAHDPRLVAALPPVARSYLSKHIDPADAWIASAEGLLKKQARSRARNAARSLGSSWPDRLPGTALIDPSEVAEIQASCGLHAIPPDEILEAIEVAGAVLAREGAAWMLAQVDVEEIDTALLADVSKITRRRAQQLKSKRLALAQAGQLSLLEG